MGGLVACGSFLIYKFFIFKPHETDISRQIDGGKLRILVATGIFPPDIGGPATYTKILCEELPKFSWEVRVVTYSDLKNSEIRNQNSENIEYVSRKQNKLVRYLKYFRQVYKSIPWANIVYAQGPVSEGLPTWLACKLRGKKYILKVVGDYAWEQGQQRFDIKELLDEFQNKKYGILLGVIRFIQKTVTRRADKIIVPSEYLKKIVIGWGVDDYKIEVIYNTFEAPIFEATKEKIKEMKKNFNLEGDIILSVGRLVPWKGFECLIKLMPDLLKINSKFKLVIVGSGPDRNRLEFIARKLDVEDSIIFIGKLSNEDVQKYMAIANIFVLNTGYEGLSHVILEARWHGLPIITTKVGGNPELITHCETGILVDYNNSQEIKEAIIKILNDAELANRLSVNCRENLEIFSKNNMIQGTLKFFKKKFFRILNLSLDELILNHCTKTFERVDEYKELTEVDKYVVIAPTKNKKLLPYFANIETYPIFGKNKLTQAIKIFFRSRKLIKENKLNIITVQDIYFLALIGGLLSWFLKIALEIQVHGLEKFYSVRKFIAKFILQKADVVRVVSQRLKTEVVDKFEVNKKRIVVVPIYTPNIKIHKELQRSIPHIEERRNRREHFTFLTIGRLVPVKNIEMQIKAVAEVKNFHKIKLFIIGDGPEQKNLENLIKKLNLENEVKILGKRGITKQDGGIGGSFLSADCFLLTSNFEGWGMVIIEAAQFGLPIIMTNVGLAGEVVKSSESGIIIPVGEKDALVRAMVKIIENKELRDGLGSNARKIVDEELPTKEKTLEAYKRAWTIAIANKNIK